MSELFCKSVHAEWKESFEKGTVFKESGGMVFDKRGWPWYLESGDEKVILASLGDKSSGVVATFVEV